MYCGNYPNSKLEESFRANIKIDPNKSDVRLAGKEEDANLNITGSYVLKTHKNIIRRIKS